MPPRRDAPPSNDPGGGASRPVSDVPAGSVGAVQVGLVVPQFSDDAERALAVARRAEELGLDGVFAFDHLWPLGHPERPALHGPTLLAAIAAETDRVHVGSLVARVGLLPDAVLVHVFATLYRLLGDRLIVGIGTGDAANRPENVAYGVPFEPLDRRRQRLVACCRALRGIGARTWAAGTSPAARQLAAAEADGWNGWALAPDVFAVGVAELRAATASDGACEATWGGQVLVGRDEDEAGEKLARHGDRAGLVHGSVAQVADHLGALADAGGTWAVCAPLDVGTDPAAVELLAEVAERVR